VGYKMLVRPGQMRYSVSDIMWQKQEKRRGQKQLLLIYNYPIISMLFLCESSLLPSSGYKTVEKKQRGLLK
jgi:hypothetical protein